MEPGVLIPESVKCFGVERISCLHKVFASLEPDPSVWLVGGERGGGKRERRVWKTE